MKIQKSLQSIKDFILDTLFPIRCVSCDKENTWLCEPCFQKINLLFFQVCPRCEKLITQKGKLCGNCRHSGFFLDNLVIAARYKENNLSKLIHLFKYNFVENLSVPLGKIMVGCIVKHNLPLPEMIIPVPLHRRRLRWRGFNQSELLADYVAENLTPGLLIPVFRNLIVRKKHTPPQMKIGKYAERRKNLEDAFEINTNFSAERHRMSNRQGGLKTSGVQSDTFLKDKTILLIDDIATTGTTLCECAKILKQNGVKKVFGAVLARQEFEK